MRSDWLLPLCTGGERLKGDGRQEGASDAEARVAAVPLHHGGVQSGRRDPRSVLRHRHHRRGGAPARPPLHRPRARPRLCRGRAQAHRRDRAAGRPRTSTPMPSKRSEPRIPFGALIEAGLLRPGTVLSDLSGRLHARVRADGTLSARQRDGRASRLDPPGRRGGTGRAGLQRLDLLAFRTGRRAAADRPSAPAGPRGALTLPLPSYGEMPPKGAEGEGPTAIF